jgi:uncharacterized protein YeaO (DUF488 family)
MTARVVPRAQFSSRNWYDVWFPMLAPSLEVMKLGKSAGTVAESRRFVKQYRSEMSKPDADHALELLAAMSHWASFSVGCYCEDEARCHRSVLRAILIEKGANVE